MARKLSAVLASGDVTATVFKVRKAA